MTKVPEAMVEIIRRGSPVGDEAGAFCCVVLLRGGEGAQEDEGRQPLDLGEASHDVWIAIEWQLNGKLHKEKQVTR